MVGTATAAATLSFDEIANQNRGDYFFARGRFWRRKRDHLIPATPEIKRRNLEKDARNGRGGHWLV